MGLHNPTLKRGANKQCAYGARRDSAEVRAERTEAGLVDPQRLKPRWFFEVDVRAEARTLHWNESSLDSGA